MSLEEEGHQQGWDSDAAQARLFEIRRDLSGRLKVYWPGIPNKMLEVFCERADSVGDAMIATGHSIQMVLRTANVTGLDEGLVAVGIRAEAWMAEDSDLDSLNSIPPSERPDRVETRLVWTLQRDPVSWVTVLRQRGQDATLSRTYAQNVGGIAHGLTHYLDALVPEQVTLAPARLQ